MVRFTRWFAMGIVLCAGCGSKLAPQTGGDADAGTDAGIGARWVNVTSNLAGLSSECGNMTFVSARPDRDMLIAGVALQGLWSNTAGATAWSRLGQGSGSAVIKNRPSAIVYDPDHLETFWESGTYDGGGVYKTTDNGTTFAQLGSVAHSDLVSVDLGDPFRSTLLAGGHEQTATLYRSTNGGASWADIGAQLPAGAGNTSAPLVIDSQIHLLGTWGGAASGVYRTANGGASWTRVYPAGARSRPLVASDHSIYWLLENDGGLIRSVDSGTDWTRTVGPGTLVTSGEGSSLLELPGGRLASLGQSQVLVSSDHGVTWEGVGPALPFAPWGLAYSTSRKALYIWHLDCGTTVPADGILQVHYE